MGIHQGGATLLAALWCCLWGRGQRENSAAHLLSSSPLSHEPLCETGSFSHNGKPRHSPQSTLSLSFTFSQPCPHSPQSHLRFSASTCLTGLVGLVDCFFDSLVVRVPCSLIFWHSGCLLILDWLLSSFWLCGGRVSTYASILAGTYSVIFNLIFDTNQIPNIYLRVDQFSKIF